MSALGLKIIDGAVQSTNEWVNDVNDSAQLDNKQRAYRVLRAVLHVVRDHLNVDEAAQLAAQMPVLIRGIYYEGWNPSDTPVVERSADGFVARIQECFGPDPMGDAQDAIAAVIAVLRSHISEGEMSEVESAFTTEIRTLFG